MQLEFFEKSETEILREELDKLRETTENMRRGLFSRFNELSRLFIEQQQQIDILSKNAFGQINDK